ncbi:MAG: DPP IV N-terminal domain-containing protein [Bacteroidia bacterium]|nr:DPP IV N-terminal domain-containing protein [Bacteroidia bacterium]
MMKTKLLLLFLVLSLSCEIVALGQNKTIDLKEAVTGRLFPRPLPQLKWKGTTHSYTYIDAVTQNLMVADSKNEPQVLMTLDEISQAWGGTIYRFPQITWVGDDVFTFLSGPDLKRYDLKTKVSENVYGFRVESEQEETASNLNLAYTRKHNIFLAIPGNKTPLQVTFDGSRNIVYGEAAHRSEFGIIKGLFWSGSGQKLAFYRIDQSRVTDYPLTDYRKVPGEYEPEKYPMAGDQSHYATIGIYDLATKKTVYLQTGEPADQYLTNITWAPDEKSVYVAIVNRDQNHLWLNRYNATSGEKELTLFEETNEKYIEPENGPIFRPGNPNQFLWLSEKDGFKHLYLYQTSGSFVKQITQGSWEVTEFMGFANQGDKIIYQSTEVSPLERHIYAIDLTKDKKDRLTKDKGVHNAVLSGTGEYLLDTWSSLKVPLKSVIIDVHKGKEQKEIHLANNPLADHKLGEMSIFSIKSADDTDLYCRLIKPIDFDPAKKYPVMVYVYGGPHIQLIDESWQGKADLFLHYMAQQGFVVFTLDNRGSPHRGLDFEQKIYRRMGTQEMADQIEGVSYLRRQTFVDTEKIGVFGWSYGGFMTLSLMLREPGVFKVGVAGGPVVDWKMYEVMYTERYMDTPEQNPEGYETASLLNYADRLKGNLLIIQGMKDKTVVPQHSLMLIHKFVESGVQAEFFPYPEHEHNVRGIDRAHLYEKISSYFIEHLKGQ